jgi:GR25 family glycosyltransferase involved in LPS biosynthesis
MTPIAIFAFKRLDLLQQTLKALQACDGYPGGPVYVFSDAARENFASEVAEVTILRAWLKEWCSRNNAELIEAPANLGLRRSIVGGVTRLLEQFEQVIVLEDDIVVSSSFLRFMHESLNAFQSHPHVYQVSGYFIPHRSAVPETGFLSVPACWGWGTWRRAWNHYCDDAAGLLAQIEQADVNRFDIDSSYAYLDSLRQNATGKMNTWMVRWYASIFLRQGVVFYPGVSLTRNIGFSDGGTNCGPGTMARIFERQRISHRLPVFEASLSLVEENLVMRGVMRQFYLWQQAEWCKPSTMARWRSRCRRLMKLLGIR